MEKTGSHYSNAWGSGNLRDKVETICGPRPPTHRVVCQLPQLQQPQLTYSPRPLQT